MSNTWHNWAGDQICAPSVIKRPTSEAELVEIVAGAAQKGERVRAVGTGHSFTDCACTDGVMIDMTGLQRVIDVDSVNGLATIEGGARLHPLLAQLAERGFGIENQGDIDKQSITGAAATATHGTGARFKNVSAQVVSARLVTAGGEVLEVSQGSAGSESDDYLAARVSIGALGVISQVTVKVVPLFTLHRADELRPLGKTLARLDEDVDGNDHFEFFVFPYGDTALTRTTRRSNEEPRPGPVWKKRLGEEFENAGLHMICRAGRRFPRTAPRLNRLLTRLMSPSTVQDHGWKVTPARATSSSPRWNMRFLANMRAKPSSGSSRSCDGATCRSCIPSRCVSVPQTTRSYQLRTPATPVTSRCTSSSAWNTRTTSALSRRS